MNNFVEMFFKFLFRMRVPFLFAGLIAIFASERYFSTEPWSRWLLVSAVALIALVMLAFLWRMVFYRSQDVLNLVETSAQESEKQCVKILFLWYALVLIGVAVYFLYRYSLNDASGPLSIVQKILLGGWLLPLTFGFVGLVGSEWGLRKVGRGRFADVKRFYRMSQAWTIVSCLIVMFAALNFTFVSKNKSWDLSYLKTAKPSESTRAVIEASSELINIGVFFEQSSDVRIRVKPYFDQLGKGLDGKVKIQEFDAEINPKAADEFRASKNGIVVVKVGQNLERFEIGKNLTQARKNLKNLDQEMQKILTQATAKRKTLYFSRGHGELSWTGSDLEPLKSVKLLEGFLRDQNFSLRFFGVSDGSGREVPSDADAVMILGGDQPMLKEEVDALDRYVRAGGKVFVMLDIDAPSQTIVGPGGTNTGIRSTKDDPLLKWLSDRGINYVAKPLANIANSVSVTRSEMDVWFLFTNVFTSHESVTSLARNDQRAALLLYKSGSLQVTGEYLDYQNFETVRSLSDTFIDENADFRYSEKNPVEKRNPYVLGAVSVAKATDPAAKAGKVVVLADASVVSDALIKNIGNSAYFVESLRWLTGDLAAGKGVANTEEDVKIQHSKKEDLAWFYSTVILVPALVLGLGALATKKGRGRRRSHHADVSGGANHAS